MTAFEQRIEREDEEDRINSLPLRSPEGNVQRILAIIRIWYSLAW